MDDFITNYYHYYYYRYITAWSNKLCYLYLQKDMKIFVKILDFDSNNDADIIGKYNGEIVDLTTTPEFVEIPLTPSSTSRRAKTSISWV